MDTLRRLKGGKSSSFLTNDNAVKEDSIKQRCAEFDSFESKFKKACKAAKTYLAAAESTCWGRSFSSCSSSALPSRIALESSMWEGAHERYCSLGADRSRGSYCDRVGILRRSQAQPRGPL